MDISRHLEVIERLVGIVEPGTEASLEANGYEYNIEYTGTLYSVEISKNGLKLKILYNISTKKAKKAKS